MVKGADEMMVWGCDPGASGAFSLFDAGNGVVEVYDMPIVEVRGKRVISPQLIRDILAQHDAPLWIEQVSARPGQGVTSMFNFGKAYGVVLGVAAGLGMPTNYVTPQQWQKSVRCPAGKDGSRARAMELMPAYSHFWARKKDDGRADAALIAYYGFTYARGVESAD